MHVHNTRGGNWKKIIITARLASYLSTFSQPQILLNYNKTSSHPLSPPPPPLSSSHQESSLVAIISSKSSYSYVPALNVLEERREEAVGKWREVGWGQGMAFIIYEREREKKPQQPRNQERASKDFLNHKRATGRRGGRRRLNEPFCFTSPARSLSSLLVCLSFPFSPSIQLSIPCRLNL